MLGAVDATPGCLISLEGGEGSGKTTQCGLLVDWLRALGVRVTTVREPGGTELGERLRAVLLDPALPALRPETEVLLFAAARSEAVAGVIVPALRRGDVVVCDRYTDSSLAYQGFGLGAELDFIRSVNAAITGGVRPDLTLLFDVPRPVGVRRRQGASPDRIEGRPERYHETVRRGYLALAAAEPDRFAILDAARELGVVQADVRSAVDVALTARGLGRPSPAPRGGGRREART